MAFWPKIAIDTNVLLHSPEKIEEILEITGKKTIIEIPIQVKNELETLSNRSLKSKKQARLAEKIILQFDIKTIQVNAKNADDALEKLSHTHWILTMDAKLRQKIKKSNGQLLEMREIKKNG